MNLSFPGSPPRRLADPAPVTLVTDLRGNPIRTKPLVAIGTAKIEPFRPNLDTPIPEIEPVSQIRKSDLYSQAGPIEGGGKAVTVLGFYSRDAALHTTAKGAIDRLSADWQKLNIGSIDSDFRFMTLADAGILKNGKPMDDSDLFVIVEFPRDSL